MVLPPQKCGVAFVSGPRRGKHLPLAPPSSHSPRDSLLSDVADCLSCFPKDIPRPPLLVLAAPRLVRRAADRQAQPKQKNKRPCDPMGQGTEDPKIAGHTTLPPSEQTTRLLPKAGDCARSARVAIEFSGGRPPPIRGGRPPASLSAKLAFPAARWKRASCLRQQFM